LLAARDTVIVVKLTEEAFMKAVMQQFEGGVAGSEMGGDKEEMLSTRVGGWTRLLEGAGALFTYCESQARFEGVGRGGCGKGVLSIRVTQGKDGGGRGGGGQGGRGFGGVSG
jgi:hypothetical protein